MDRTVAQGAIKNADPNKHYVWAYKVGEAVGYYENLGYEIETVRADGPRATTARKKAAADGQPVEWFGNVLMSLPKESNDDVIGHDEMIAGQQAEVDQLEARILSKGGGVDSLRGIQGVRGRDGSPVLGFENKTSGPQVELE